MSARLVALACAVLVGTSVAQPAPPVRTGGVGEDERRAMEGEARYNLKVVTAERSGAYVADVDIAVLDERGQRVVATRMTGPWLLAELPPGRYRVVADLGGERQARDVVVGRTGRQEIVLQWPGPR
jgi:hypothetical protein